jgi:enamine deaminase RidA (YjgF/YER057c/UK114 family)
MSDAATVQREAATFFGDRPLPPLVFVEWKSNASTPIEIELIAWGGKDRGEPAVEYLTPPGMSASPVFSRVARINHSPMIYTSGLYASPGGQADANPNTPAAAEREVKEVFASLERLLNEAGSDFRHLAKATYYVANDAASAKLNELRPNYYDPQRPPAASKAAVTGVGRAGLGLTLDLIAVPASADLNRR